MKQKIGPYIFIVILLLILVFIVGIRYGQKVEKTNKIINYLISIPPTQTPAPTQKPLEFKSYIYKYCGIKFLYPSTLEEWANSSTGARLNFIDIKPDKTFSNNFAISFDCSPDNIMFEEEMKTATEEIKFQNKNVKILKENNPLRINFQLTNKYNGKKVSFFVVESLYPLLEKSLEFTQ